MEIDATWQGRRVLITGDSGFKGSWLSLWLALKGADVYGLSLEVPSVPAMSQAIGTHHIKSYRTDIGELAGTLEILKKVQPEVVFHLAAQPIVAAGYRDPILTYRTNVMGTANVLEAVRRTPSVRAVVIVTSDKCYDNREWIYPYRETDRLGGWDPYSASKACAELIVQSFQRSFQSERHSLGIASVRAGNVIGGGDWADHRLVPDLVRGVVAGAPVVLRYPRATRPWQHVLEPLHGYITLAAKLWESPAKYSEPWNFGPDYADVWSVRELVDAFLQLWGSGDIHESADPSWHDAGELRLDSTKSHSLLGWRPVWSSRHALASTVEWYKNYYDYPDNPDRIRDLTIHQINQFERDARPKEAKENNSDD